MRNYVNLCVFTALMCIVTTSANNPKDESALSKVWNYFGLGRKGEVGAEPKSSYPYSQQQFGPCAMPTTTTTTTTPAPSIPLCPYPLPPQALTQFGSEGPQQGLPVPGPQYPIPMHPPQHFQNQFPPPLPPSMSSVNLNDFSANQGGPLWNKPGSQTPGFSPRPFNPNGNSPYPPGPQGQNPFFNNRPPLSLPLVPVDLNAPSPMGVLKPEIHSPNPQPISLVEIKPSPVFPPVEIVGVKPGAPFFVEPIVSDGKPEPPMAVRPVDAVHPLEVKPIPLEKPEKPIAVGPISLEKPGRPEPIAPISAEVPVAVMPVHENPELPIPVTPITDNLLGKPEILPKPEFLDRPSPPFGSNPNFQGPNAISPQPVKPNEALGLLPLRPDGDNPFGPGPNDLGPNAGLPIMPNSVYPFNPNPFSPQFNNGRPTPSGNNWKPFAPPGVRPDWENQIPQGVQVGPNALNDHPDLGPFNGNQGRPNENQFGPFRPPPPGAGILVTPNTGIPMLPGSNQTGGLRPTPGMKPFRPEDLGPSNVNLPYLPVPLKPNENLRPFHPAHCIPPPSTFVPPGFSVVKFIDGTCGKEPVPPCSMLEMLQRLRLRTFPTLIRLAGLEQLFIDSANYTLFVPVDVAFELLPRWFLESLIADKKLLQNFLFTHFIEADVPLSTLGNEYLMLNKRPGNHRLRATIAFPDLDYPTIMIDAARVLRGDILTTNGRLNIIDKVLKPNPARNAAQYLEGVDDLKKFFESVKEAGLLNVLEGSDPITLFVPYNNAFKKLEFDELLQDKKALQNFCKYHMVNGSYYSAGLQNGQYLTTNYLKEIKINIGHDGFTKYLSLINGYIKILKSDITTTNAVIHIVEETISADAPFYIFDASNEFGFEYEILRRNMNLSVQENKDEGSS